MTKQNPALDHLAYAVHVFCWALVDIHNGEFQRARANLLTSERWADQAWALSWWTTPLPNQPPDQKPSPDEQFLLAHFTEALTGKPTT